MVCKAIGSMGMFFRLRPGGLWSDSLFVLLNENGIGRSPLCGLALRSGIAASASFHLSWFIRRKKSCRDGSCPTWPKYCHPGSMTADSASKSLSGLQHFFLGL